MDISGECSGENIGGGNQIVSLDQAESGHAKELLDNKSKSNAALRPKELKVKTERHKAKLQELLNIWEKATESMTVLNSIIGVCFKKEFLIGSGSYGSEVYICLGSDGVDRAIKRLPRLQCDQFGQNEKKILTSPEATDSPRIVNYWFYDENSSRDFCYLILNLYECNLEEHIREKGASMTEFECQKIIRQMMEGLEALHTRKPGIVHRDLKPTNILVKFGGDIALSDFGIGRIFQEGATTYNNTNPSGTRGWVANECVDWERLYSNELQGHPPASLRWKEKSDIQVAGMIAFFVATKGKHPFGAPIDRLKNLHDNDPTCLDELANEVLKDLLSQMLANDLDIRPYVEQVLMHPYFLSLQNRMSFLQKVGNEPEIKNFNGDPSCFVSNELDNRSQVSPRSSLIPNNWQQAIGLSDFDILRAGLHREYNGERYTHCLRLIRNVFQHPDGKLDQLNNNGQQATSLEQYFSRVFPHLPLVVYQIIRKHQTWKERSAFSALFPVINRREAQVENNDSEG